MDFLIENHKKAIDWIITITFYSALQYCQAKLERDFNLHPMYHTFPKNRKKGRLECVTDKLPLSISSKFYELYNESRKARYIESGTPYREITTYKDREKLINDARGMFPPLISLAED